MFTRVQHLLRISITMWIVLCVWNCHWIFQRCFYICMKLVLLASVTLLKMRITAVKQMDLQEESGAWTRSTSQTIQCASESSTIIDTKDDRAQEGPPTLRECLMKATMSNALKPLMLTCCAAGLVFHVGFGRNGMRKYVTFSHCYSLVVMLFLAFSVLYYLMIFHSDAKLDASFLMEIAMSVYNIESFAHFVCFYVASWKKTARILYTMEEGQIGVFITSHFN